MTARTIGFGARAVVGLPGLLRLPRATVPDQVLIQAVRLAVAIVLVAVALLAVVANGMNVGAGVLPVEGPAPGF